MATTFLTPYLFFSGDCREAMTFYQSIMGGKLSVLTFGEGDPDSPDNIRDLVMHANIMEGPIELMASDDHENHDYGVGNTQLTLHGNDAAALGDWFEKLAEGGTVNSPLKLEVWGDTYGELTDRFGIRWMFNISSAN